MPKRFVVIFFLLASTAFAKTHQDDFQVPCDNVWAAVRQVLMHSGKYGVLFMSNEDMNASYNIGGNLGGKRTNSVQLRPNGAGCTMSVQTAFAGLAHNDAGDFLTRVKEALAEVPTSRNSQSARTSSDASPSGGSTKSEPEPKEKETKPASTPATSAVPAMPVSQPTPTAPTGQPSTVTMKSTPDGADITVDGKYVGSTPSTVKLSPGDHAISIEKSGFKAWQRTVSVSAGGNVTINATLEKSP